jgi:hypothetical protein
MKLFSRPAQPSADPLIEKLVRRISADNGLPSDGHCASSLAEAVQAACAHARGMVEALDAPRVLDRRQGTAGALGPILFDSRKDAVDALRGASRVRQVFADPDVRECFFLLTMHRREYVVFGTEMEGEVVRRDVMQDAVEFRDHNFSAAAPALAELRDMLTENVVLFLTGLATRRLNRDEALRTHMHRSEALLRAQMQTLDRALRESGPFAAPTALQDRASEAGREMRELQDRLSSLPPKSDPAQCLRELREVLLAPQRHVRLERVEMRVGDFGVKSAAGRPVSFHECVLGDEDRLAVIIASMDRDNARYLWPDLEGPA